MSRRTAKNQIGGQFAPRLIEMLASPAYRVMSLSGHRVLARLEIEFAAHGGKGEENGRLQVTYDDFEEYGIHRHSVAPAIREVAALGFIEITEAGRAGNADWRAANKFRLTFRRTKRADPTDDWRRIATIEDAQAIAEAARCTSPKTSHQCRKMPRTVAETVTETPKVPVVETATTPIVRKPPLLSISRGGGRQTPPQNKAAPGGELGPVRPSRAANAKPTPTASKHSPAFCLGVFARSEAACLLWLASGLKAGNGAAGEAKL